jgi:hypothetical protein
MAYGIPSVGGHSDAHDDLFKPQRGAAERRGYLGDTEHISAAGVNENASPDYSVTGGGEAIVNGWRQGGTNAWDQDVDRYRRMGEEGQSRKAVQLDQGQANEARGLQMGALGMMGDAARGNAPSRAAELGNAGTDDAIRAASAGMGAARGPGQAIAATAGAQAGAQQQQTKLGAGISDMRAQEMLAAQTGYAKGAQGVQGQDIGAATQNAQLEAQNRAANESRQQGMERRGWDTRNQQQMAADRYQRNRDAQELAIRKQRAAENAADDAALTSAVSTTLGAAQMASDERAKKNIMPVGSLSGVYGGRR